MVDENCQHEWVIANLRNGYLVTEGCTHCGRRTSFFTLEDRHHMDSYIDGDHRWRFLGSAQAVKFDLECKKCAEVVNLDKVMGLMLCLGCKEDCMANLTGKELGGEEAWVYLGLCADSSHVSGECVGSEATETLTEYFNSRIKTPGKSVIFAPCSLRGNIDTCQGEIIADLGLKDIY